MTEKDLLKLKEKADKAKEKGLKLNGKLETLQAQLAEDFDCKSIEKAQEKIEQIENTKEKNGKELKKLLKKIGKKFNLDDTSRD